MSHTRSVTVALVVATFALSACGNSTKSSPTVQTVSKSEFIARANTICHGVNAKRDLIKSDALAGYITNLAAVEKSAGADLGKLVPPASLAAEWRQITEGTNKFANVLAELERYASSKNPKLPASLTTAATTAQQQVLTTAKRDGLVECSKTYVHTAEQSSRPGT